MKKFTVTVCSGFVFSACIYFACISSASSQVDKGGSHSHQTDQKSKTIVSTPEQEPLQLEPIPEKVTEPKARITAPVKVSAKSQVILDFTGTVSSGEPDFDIAFSPEGSTSSVTKLYHRNRSLAYGLLIPEKVGKYRVVLVAFATDDGKVDRVRSYAFIDIDVTEPSKPPEPPMEPLPTPPDTKPPLPVPVPPQPKQEDTYGMYSYTKDLLEQMPTTDKWQTRIPLIYDSFDKMIAQSSSFTDATKFVQATSDLYKSALGKDYNYFSHYFFIPLKEQLGKINSSGKLPSTVEAHAQAWKEISKALHEVKIPVASPVRSHP